MRASVAVTRAGTAVAVAFVEVVSVAGALVDFVLVALAFVESSLR